jgi:hypothetical protein
LYYDHLHRNIFPLIENAWGNKKKKIRVELAKAEIYMVGKFWHDLPII